MNYQKLIDVSEAEEKSLSVLWGAWGEYPKGWREVEGSDHELRILTGCWSPKFISFRQMGHSRKPGAPDFFSGYLLFYHNKTGVGYQLSGNQPKFYRFGCDHDMKLLANLGNCLNAYQCSKCGFREDIDSSD